MSLFNTSLAAALFIASLVIQQGSSGPASGVSTVAQGSGSGSAQGRIVGEVSSVDAAGGTLTVRTDAGGVVRVSVDERTTYQRIPPGETSLERAASATFADVRAGDRILVVESGGTEGRALARRVILTSGPGARGGEDARRRPVVGVVTALRPDRREVALQARGRDNARQVTVAVSDNTRIRQFAPDSLNLSDAQEASFAALRVGDQLRVRGEMNEDGSRIVAEEIHSGSFRRIGGTVTAVNPTSNEIMIQDELTGAPVTVTIGRRTSLRRLTPELAATINQPRQGRRERRRERDGDSTRDARNRNAGGAGNETGAANANDNARGRGERAARGRAGGRNFQQLLDEMPAVTLAELKQGDSVFVMSTTSAGTPRTTAAILITGEEKFISRWLQSGRGSEREGQMNPGLPGDVLGGGVNRNEVP